MKLSAIRPWFRFSLRTLLVGVMLACVGFGWLGMKLQEGKEQARAIDAVGRQGGHFLYDYDFDAAGHFKVNRDPADRSWFGKLCGDEIGQDIYSVNLTDLRWTDAEMHWLSAFKKLNGLGLGRTQVTDAGLIHISRLTELRTLYLDHVPISDEGLVHLMSLEKLESLDLRGTQVTGEGLLHLKSLRRLKWLAADEHCLSHHVRRTLQEELPNLRFD
jgi:hypothetical protein